MAALGLTTKRTLGLLAGIVVFFGALALLVDLVLSWFGVGFGAAFFWRSFGWICGVGALVGAIAYLGTYVKFTTKSRRPWYRTLHLTGWQMAFYDTSLNPNVQHARHALAIDENRKDFDKVAWTTGPNSAPQEVTTTQKDGYTQLIQLWFAGVHSDIGGSYPENEAHLSDIALAWMIDEAAGLPEPMKIDRSVLHLWPSADGLQHDERKNTVAGWPDWFVRLLTVTGIWRREDLGWEPWVRTVPRNAPLHPSVLQRFQVPEPGVLHDDITQPYRPEGLRNHVETHQLYP